MSAPTIDNLPDVTPFVEVGIGSTYNSASLAQWDVDRWDDPAATWGGTEPYWVDVTCHVLDASSQAGRERIADQWEVGTATITCENESGWANFPRTNIEDAASTAELLTVRPGRSLRLGVRVAGFDPVTLWAGYIDSADPTYDPVDGARITLECIDAKGDAGKAQVAALTTEVGLHQTVTQRITSILAAAGWPTYRQKIDASSIPLRATKYGAKAVDLLNRAADSAGGQVLGDLGGDHVDPRVVFHGRDWPSYDLNDKVAATIANTGYRGTPGHYDPFPLAEGPDGLFDPTPSTPVEDPPGSSLYRSTAATVVTTEDPAGSGLLNLTGPWVPPVYGDTCPSSWALSWSRSDITTRVVLGRSGEADRVYDDTTGGLSLFGAETYTRRDMETDTDPDLNSLAARVLALRNWRYMPRVASVVIDAKAANPETVRTMCLASPYVPTRIACQHYLNGVAVIDRTMIVVGVEHSITPSAWQARIALDDVTPFLETGPQPARWDETDIAEWDAATWARGL